MSWLRNTSYDVVVASTPKLRFLTDPFILRILFMFFFISARSESCYFFSAGIPIRTYISRKKSPFHNIEGGAGQSHRLRLRDSGSRIFSRCSAAGKLRREHKHLCQGWIKTGCSAFCVWKMLVMGLILGGNSEHVARAWSKIGLFGGKIQLFRKGAPISELPSNISTMMLVKYSRY